MIPQQLQGATPQGVRGDDPIEQQNQNRNPAHPDYRYLPQVQLQDRSLSYAPTLGFHNTNSEQDIVQSFPATGTGMGSGVLLQLPPPHNCTQRRSSTVYTPTTTPGYATDLSSSLSPTGAMTSHVPPPASVPEDSRRRKGRQATACVECNRRKQRCDGRQPCGLCTKRGVQEACTYPIMQNTSWAAPSSDPYDSPAQSTVSGDRRKTKQQKHSHNHSHPNSTGSNSATSASGSRAAANIPGSGGSQNISLNDESTPPQTDVPSHFNVPSHVRPVDTLSQHAVVVPLQSYSGLGHHLDHRFSISTRGLNISRVPPTSSERDNVNVSSTIPEGDHNSSVPTGKPTSKPPKSPETTVGNRFWRSHNDPKPETEIIPNTSGGKHSGTSSDTDPLMEENEAAGVGSLRSQRGPWDHDVGEKTFFGTSHFGPQLAAKALRGGQKSTPTVPLSDVRLGPFRGIAEIDRTKPYTLETQTRELVSCIPTKEECDRYVGRFFERYNMHNDIVPESEFLQSYNDFWQLYNDRTATEVDLRQLALLLIVLAFGVLLDYAPELARKRRTTLTSMRLPEEQNAVISTMLDDLEAQSMSLKDREEKSAQWSWAARRALSESCSFFGESIDTVRAGLLLSLYLNVCRRVPEAWTAICTAIRAAQAQGMHVDGSSWKGMPSKEAELRRRLWAQLYIVDRSISLFLGRPVCIQDDGQFTTWEPANLHDDELDATPVFPRPLTTPTKSTFLILHFRLAAIIGYVQSTCFNLKQRKYANVLECENKFRAFKESLPAHFRLDGEGTDYSLDGHDSYRWLPMQRQTLNSKFHLARISLHRPYIFRAFAIPRGTGTGVGGNKTGNGNGNDYGSSREPLLFSAIADLRLRIDQNEHDPLDRFKWMTVASGFFASSIIGILCHIGYRDSRFELGRLRQLLQQYIALEEKTVRRDEALEMELNVLKRMEARAIEREDYGKNSNSSRRGRGRSLSTTTNRGRSSSSSTGRVKVFTYPNGQSGITSLSPTNITTPTTGNGNGQMINQDSGFPYTRGMQPIRSPYEPVIYDPTITSTSTRGTIPGPGPAPGPGTSTAMSMSIGSIQSNSFSYFQAAAAAAAGAGAGAGGSAGASAGQGQFRLLAGSAMGGRVSTAAPFDSVSTSQQQQQQADQPQQDTLNASQYNLTGDNTSMIQGRLPILNQSQSQSQQQTQYATTISNNNNVNVNNVNETEGVILSNNSSEVHQYQYQYQYQNQGGGGQEGGFTDVNALQEWLMPFEGDPTTFGLPDASEGMAWQTILESDIDFNDTPWEISSTNLNLNPNLNDDQNSSLTNQN